LFRLQTFKKVTRIVAKDFKTVDGTKTAGMNTSVLGLMSYNVERLYTVAVYFRSLPTADEGKGCAVVLFIVR